MAQKHRFDLTPFIVPPGKKIKLSDYDPAYVEQLEGKKHSKETLEEDIADLAEAQELLWASKQYSLLIIFQAMDAAGKDGTIKHVMSGVNPQGCDVFSFKAPSEEERLHNFLWRPEKYLPPRGKIAIFNRSYYEEVLVVRAHPEMLDHQWLPVEVRNAPLWQIWDSRYEDINDFEKKIARNGIEVIKFFLNVSKEEQRNRFLKRLQRSEKNWKFSASDFKERAYWDEYQHAFNDMINATSTEWAPWYVVPADNKWFMRAVVADVITSRVEALNLKYPEVPPEKLEELNKIKKALEEEDEEKLERV
ncbi:MAG TPA: polyphosphate kinase 2 family protein [Cyclobacteriaceae bacterium]